MAWGETKKGVGGDILVLLIVDMRMFLFFLFLFSPEHRTTTHESRDHITPSSMLRRALLQGCFSRAILFRLSATLFMFRKQQEQGGRCF